MKADKSVICNGTEIVSTVFKNVSVGKGYRVHIAKTNPDYTGITYTSKYDKFLVSAYASDDTMVECFYATYFNESYALPEYIDFYMPENATVLKIHMRAAVGFEQIVTLEEIDFETVHSNLIDTIYPVGDKSVARIIKRARRLSDIKWKPSFNLNRIARLSSDNYSSAGGINYIVDNKFIKDKEYRGLPYSENGNLSIGHQKLYLGVNVPVEAFLTSLRYDNSALALKTDADPSNLYATLYGTVCSALTSYAYDMPCVYTYYIPEIPGLAAKGTITADNDKIFNLISPGDQLNKSGHTALITDKDVVNQRIEITESTLGGLVNWREQGSDVGGMCRRKWWPIKDVLPRWADYIVYQYDYKDRISYKPNPYISVYNEGDSYPPIDMPCIPYYGENFLYFKGMIENTKVLIEMTDFDELVVMKDGEHFGTFPINGANEVEVGFAEVGNYSAYLHNTPDNVKGEGKTVSCHWRVTDKAVRPVITKGDTETIVQVTAQSKHDIPWGLMFLPSIRHTTQLCPTHQAYDVTKDGNTYTFKVATKPGTQNYAKVVFRNGDEFWYSDVITL